MWPKKVKFRESSAWKIQLIAKHPSLFFTIHSKENKTKSELIEENGATALIKCVSKLIGNVIKRSKLKLFLSFFALWLSDD